MRIVGLVLELLEMNYEEGDLHDLSGAFTYASSLMPAAHEALRDLRKDLSIDKEANLDPQPVG